MPKRNPHAHRYPPHFDRVVIGRARDLKPNDARKAAARALALVAEDPEARFFFVLAETAENIAAGRSHPGAADQWRSLARWLIRLDPADAARIGERTIQEMRALLEAAMASLPVVEHEAVDALPAVVAAGKCRAKKRAGARAIRSAGEKPRSAV